MKTISLLAVLISGLAWASAGEAPNPTENASRTIRAYRFGACDYWQNFSTDFGRMYGCGFSPQTIVTPNAYDVDRELKAANAKIAALEARVQALEEKLAPSP